MLRPLPVCLSLLLLAAVPAGHAQVGGIIKKATGQVTGKKTDSTVAPTATPKSDPSSMVITNEVADRYFQSLSARDAAAHQWPGLRPVPLGAECGGDKGALGVG